MKGRARRTYAASLCSAAFLSIAACAGGSYSYVDDEVTYIYSDATVQYLLQTVGRVSQATERITEFWGDTSSKVGVVQLRDNIDHSYAVKRGSKIYYLVGAPGSRGAITHKVAHIVIGEHPRFQLFDYLTEGIAVYTEFLLTPATNPDQQTEMIDACLSG